MRRLSAALIFLVCASVSFVFIWFVWFYVSAAFFGEWASENRTAILFVLATLSVLAGLLLTRRLLRRDS
jgi:hypothetical protein